MVLVHCHVVFPNEIIYHFTLSKPNYVFSARTIFLVRVDGRYNFGIYIGIDCWRKVLSVFDVVCGSFTPLFCYVVGRSLGMIYWVVDRSLRFYVVLCMDRSEWKTALWIAHSDLMVCCCSVTRKDLMYCDRSLLHYLFIYIFICSRFNVMFLLVAVVVYKLLMSI